MRIGLALAAILMVSQAKAGSLSWEKSTIEIAAGATDKKVEAIFAFTNTSSSPVTLGSVRTSCGCTTADLAKKVYAPGESGTLKAVFVIGGRKGRQEKTIVVPTGKGEQDVLMLRADIPDTIKVNKEMLSWEVGEPLEPQSFEVTVQEAGTATVKGVKALGKGFEVNLKEIEPGAKYEVSVTPQSTERPVRSTIRLEVADPGSRSLYLRVEVKE